MLRTGVRRPLLLNSFTLSLDRTTKPFTQEVAPMDVADEDVLVTPCCDTKIEPGAGFRSVFCCSQEYTREDLEN